MEIKHTARNAAVQALLQVQENEGYSNLVLDKTLKAFSLDHKDSGLAAVLFYGVLERQLTLDYFIKMWLKNPEKPLDHIVQIILRIAFFQICFLDRIPDSAAVNEAVEAVRAFGRSKHAGFVNAILRNALRQKQKMVLPGGNDVKSLSLRYSIPEELIQLWKQSYGEDVLFQLLDSFNEKAPTYIRINPLKTSVSELKDIFASQDVQVEPLKLSPWTAQLHITGTAASGEAFDQGLYHVQDLSAQLICELLSPKSGERVCDCCAAPGGKSFTMAQMMNDTGEVLSFDLYKGRVGLIQKGAKRLGLNSIHASLHNAQDGFDSIAPVDKMLCDVPCSGFGVIRRKPEIRYKNLELVKQLPEIQFDILMKASEAVKPGGILCYSTCTLNPEENQKVARRFLLENKQYEPCKLHLPEGVHSISSDSEENMATLAAFSGASDGFFVAMFRKK
jgi:16S rRNA (cytosine967-C5)-methyltransferase